MSFQSRFRYGNKTSTNLCYNMLMNKVIKQPLRNIKRIVIPVGALLIAALVAGAIYFFGQDRAVTSDEASKANIELYQKAARNSDPAICDQIKGGINATDNNGPSGSDKYDFSVGVSVKFVQMNEEQAIERCKVNVQRVIDNKKS